MRAFPTIGIPQNRIILIEEPQKRVCHFSETLYEAWYELETGASEKCFCMAIHACKSEVLDCGFGSAG